MISKILTMFLLIANPVAWGAIVQIKAGEKIQEKIDAAQSGDVLEVYPGIYHEALHLDKENITVRGVIEAGKWPVLDGRGVLNDGVIASGSGFSMERIHIRRYRANGVTTQGANNVRIQWLRVEDTGIYGIYPTHGKNILISDNVISGIADAGIYVGICEYVDVLRNLAFENVAGIEIENSHHVLVEGNQTDRNTGGILVFVLPGLPVKNGSDIIVRKNFVGNNNFRNFAEAGAIVGAVPPGSGIIVLAADDVSIYQNMVTQNSVAGVILADLGVMTQAGSDPKVEPNPDNVVVAENYFESNGTKGMLDYVWWMHFLFKNMFSNANVKGAEDAIPPSGDIALSGKGTQLCADPRQGHTVWGPQELLAKCDSQHSLLVKHKAIVSMQNSEAGSGAAEILPADKGEHWFKVVCAGCHAYDYRLIGPPIKEIQAKYKDNPAGIAAFAKSPTKVRSGFPTMPSQAHLGDETLSAVGVYVLGLTD